ncbi:MAG: ribokinase [Bacillales bacterium]|jgi:ribokinase|nr:ribokinase [Bacillales bacterium]
MKKCFVVGSINCDFVIHSDYLPKLGETISGSGFATLNGGKGANQAVALARSGIHTILVGAVGDDVFGLKMVDDFKKDNIDVSYIRTLKGVATGTAMITVVKGNNQIILDAGANALLVKEQVLQALETSNVGDVLLTQYEVSSEIVAYSLKLAKEKGLITIVNPAPFREIDTSLYAYIDFIIPNEFELQKIEKDIENYNTKLIVTLGDKGSQYGQEIVPIVKSKVVDTTAAGDTYIAYFIYGLLSNKSIVEAMQIGTKAASIAISRHGAQPSIPKINEIN